MKLIQETRSILITCPPGKVFNYITDLGNDSAWRAEINASTLLSNHLGLNCMVEEDAFLSRRVPSHINRLICTQFIKDKRVAYETVRGDLFFLHNCREVKEISPQQTLVSYHLRFNPEIVRYALGFNLPGVIIRCVTHLSMRKYLKKLKQLLEHGH